jgi:hypothetical protein
MIAANKPRAQTSLSCLSRCLILVYQRLTRPARRAGPGRSPALPPPAKRQRAAASFAAAGGGDRFCLESDAGVLAGTSPYGPGEPIPHSGDESCYRDAAAAGIETFEIQSEAWILACLNV